MAIPSPERQGPDPQVLARQGVEQFPSGDGADVQEHGMRFPSNANTPSSPRHISRTPAAASRAHHDENGISTRHRRRGSKLASIAPLAAQGGGDLRPRVCGIPNGRLVTSLNRPGGESPAHVAHSQDGDSHLATLRSPASTNRNDWCLDYRAVGPSIHAMASIRCSRTPSDVPTPRTISIDPGEPFNATVPEFAALGALRRACVTIGESARASRENGFRRYGESYRTVEAQDDLSRDWG